MARLKALKTFRVSGTGQTVRPGDEFEAKNAADYEKRGLAVPVGDVPASLATAPRRARVENKAADAGPLPSPGGGTGVTSQSLQLSRPAPAPKRRGRPPKAAAE